jgi:hypothetical protein
MVSTMMQTFHILPYLSLSLSLSLTHTHTHTHNTQNTYIYILLPLPYLRISFQKSVNSLRKFHINICMNFPSFLRRPQLVLKLITPIKCFMNKHYGIPRNVTSCYLFRISRFYVLIFPSLDCSEMAI